MKYNDNVQLEDMYTDLMNDLNIKMQKNRKIKTALKNQAKYLLNYQIPSTYNIYNLVYRT